MRRHLNLFFSVLCLILAAFPFQAEAQFSGSGSGTQSDPYLIYTPIQLNEVRNFNGNRVYFKLMADIDLTEWLAEHNPTQGWQPIGTESSPFKGYFEGNHHTVSGVFVKRDSTNYVGFFGYADHATFGNFIVKGSEIKGNNYTGGFIGYAKSCYINANSADIKVTGHNYVGGFVGVAEACQVRNATYTGYLTARAYVGGIVGKVNNGTIVTICRSHADVYATSDYVSTGIGISDSATISNIQIEGNVTGRFRVGGIVGSVTGSTATTLTNCTSKGIKTGTGHVAGLVGRSLAPLTISDSYSVGDIINERDNSGGLVGRSESSLTITDSHSVGNVSADSLHAGGLVGYCMAANIDNCYALGDVNALDYAGGLIGCSNYNEAETYNSFILKNSYYNGNVVAFNENVGGLIGCVIGYGQMSQNHSYSTVNGKNNVGGLIGYAEGSPSNTLIIKSNAAIVENINAIDNVGRIYGSIGNNVAVGECGTSEENIGVSTTMITLNGLQQEMPDNPQNGTSVLNSSLKQRATYQGIGWDFTNGWKVIETESYPFKTIQNAPPVISRVIDDSGTTIKGKCAVRSTVYVIIEGDTCQAIVNGTTWSVTSSSIQPGILIKAFAISDSLFQSYYVTSTVGYNGDVNGDGDVDVRDITALIDVIMNDGDNSRADVNQDGEINVVDITALIDIIMNS